MISIILPTFNRSAVLSSTIESVLNQTFKEYELIIINDCSLDKTKAVIAKYQQKDSRVKYIENPKNMGCAISRKIGIENSKEQVLVFLDDDDQWARDKLMKQYNALTHNNNDMVISDYHIKANNQLTYKDMKQFQKNFKKEILKRPGPFFQSIMIKKNIIEKIKTPFDSKAIPSEDWNFFIQLSKLNLKIGYINEPLFIWNIHQNNQSLNIKKEAQALSYILKTHYDYIKTIHGNHVIGNHYKRIARLYEKIYSEEHESVNIKNLYIKAFRVNPFSIKNLFYFLMVIIGYNKTRHLIAWIRNIRGVSIA